MYRYSHYQNIAGFIMIGAFAHGAISDSKYVWKAPEEAPMQKWRKIYNHECVK